MPRLPRFVFASSLAIVALCACSIWISAQSAALSPARQAVLAANSVRLGLSVSLLATPIGLLLAMVWWKTRWPLRRAAMMLVVALLFIPLYVQASAWQAGFAEVGWYRVAGQATDPPLFNDWRAAIWIHVASSVPWATLIIGLGLAGVAREAEEAALLETGAWPLTRWIILPQLGPWLVMAAIWIGVSSAAEMVVVDLFRIDTYARYLYQSLAQQMPPLAAALALLAAPAAISISLLGAALWLAARSAPAGMSDLYVAPVNYRFGPSRFLVLALFLVFCVLFAAIPAASLVYQAGLKQSSSGAFHWTFRSVLAALENGWKEFRIDIQWSFVIAGLAATSSLALAILGAAATGARRGLQYAPWILAAVAVSIPAPLLGLWLIPLLNRPGWWPLYRLHNETVFSPILAAGVRSWPVLFVLCWLAARDIPRDVRDLARLDGASAWQWLLRIAAPLLWPAWLISWLVGFALASGELAATLMVIPPGASTVATRVYGLIHSGVREKEAALCLLHGGLTMILAAAALGLHDWRRRR